MNAPVAAAVLASRGGPRLAAALESVSWASERVVLDPARRLEGEPLPAGVRRADEPAWAASTPWLLLIEEHEVVPPPLAESILETVRGPERFAAYRIGREVRAFGAVFRPGGAPLRLVRRPGARLWLGGGLSVELRPPWRHAGRLHERLVVRGPESLAAAVDDIDAEAAALAALLSWRQLEPRFWHLLVPPLVAGARAFAARGSRAGLWQRWTVTVLAGYRPLVAYAKLWEIRQAKVSALR